MENIVLIGFMCSGKTTIGRILAKKINYTFIDTDHHISKNENLTVGEIFDTKGEEYFRKLETQTVKEFSKSLKGTILSTGGGLPIREENVPFLKEIGRVIFLKASKETVISRLNPKVERPLLLESNPEEKIENLLNQRNPIYEKVADIEIDTNNKSMESIVEEIIEAISD